MTLRQADARALAIAVVEVLDYLHACVRLGGSARIYLAAGVDDHRLVVGLGIEGDYAYLGSASAVSALVRGAEITHALGGRFQRGVDGARMVVGLMFPNLDADCGV